MLRLVQAPRRAYPLAWRYLSTEPVKPSAKLVAEIRKRTETSIIKAREALVATNNDVESALKWIDEDLIKLGEKRATKLAGRVAAQGLVASAILSQGWGSRGGSARASMVELNCETDFVARNALFDKLAKDIAWTAAFYAEASPAEKVVQSIDLDTLGAAPLLTAESGDAKEVEGHQQTPSNTTVSSAIRDATAKIGEKIQLRRASSVVVDAAHPTASLGHRVTSFVHGSTSSTGRVQAGRIAALVCTTVQAPGLQSYLPTTKGGSPFLDEYVNVEKALARQVVGYETTSVRSGSQSESADDSSTALYDQPFDMYPPAPSDKPIGKYLEEWSHSQGMARGAAKGVDVVDFEKWTVGDGVEH